MELAAAVVGLVGTVAGLVFQYFKNKRDVAGMEAQLETLRIERDSLLKLKEQRQVLVEEQGKYVKKLEDVFKAHMRTCTGSVAELGNQLLGKKDGPK